MPSSKEASYYAHIPADDELLRRRMQAAEAHALCAVHKSTWGPDRLKARPKAIDEIKCVRRTLHKRGGPLLDLEATIREVFLRAIDAAKSCATAPAPPSNSAQRRADKEPKTGIAPKFELPPGVEGREDIHYKYRIPRRPRDLAEIEEEKPRQLRMRHPAYRNSYKRGFGRNLVAEADSLADGLQAAAIKDDNDPGPGDAAGSSRLPYSAYTIGCLAADLHVSSLGLESTGSDAETAPETGMSSTVKSAKVNKETDARVPSDTAPSNARIPAE